MILRLEIELIAPKLPIFQNETEYKVYSLHVLGFSRKNISFLLNLDYKYVKNVCKERLKDIMVLFKNGYFKVETEKEKDTIYKKIFCKEEKKENEEKKEIR